MNKFGDDVEVVEEVIEEEGSGDNTEEEVEEIEEFVVEEAKNAGNSEFVEDYEEYEDGDHDELGQTMNTPIPADFQPVGILKRKPSASDPPREKRRVIWKPTNEVFGEGDEYSDYEDEDDEHGEEVHWYGEEDEDEYFEEEEEFNYDEYYGDGMEENDDLIAEYARRLHGIPPNEKVSDHFGEEEASFSGSASPPSPQDYSGATFEVYINSHHLLPSIFSRLFFAAH